MNSDTNSDGSPRQLRILGRQVTLDWQGLQKPVAIGGVAVVALLIVLLAGRTDDPSEVLSPTPAQAAVGKVLYEEIIARHPKLGSEQRFDYARGGVGGVNRMVLPKSEWEELSQAQWVSLAQYLDSLSKGWEIRVGPVSEDGQRIVDTRAVITSERWHQKTK